MSPERSRQTLEYITCAVALSLAVLAGRLAMEHFANVPSQSVPSEIDPGIEPVPVSVGDVVELDA